ncbi:hypothetical protein CEW88_12095 [Alloyangia pacifica]|uniref:Uncharacterized protein n=1 Tax=Alloyangia pacifica TaxID=311180 RepID=A0A2U8HF04_9RHOB|nr:hypothetical protein [Alloyangia pacifica]AWI84358.1 hypothetical protein CEW88_12095 [Alloyangia pacifica]
MSTLLALTILAATSALVLGNIRVVAIDTFRALADATSRARASGTLGAKLAFGLLWLMIFLLGYV